MIAVFSVPRTAEYVISKAATEEHRSSALFFSFSASTAAVTAFLASSYLDRANCALYTRERARERERERERDRESIAEGERERDRESSAEGEQEPAVTDGQVILRKYKNRVPWVETCEVRGEEQNDFTPKAPGLFLAPSARQKSIGLENLNCLHPKSAEGVFGAERSSKKHP